jgi:hypothetical protein
MPHGLILILRSGPKVRVSKDETAAGYYCTTPQAMRPPASPVGSVL